MKDLAKYVLYLLKRYSMHTKDVISLVSINQYSFTVDCTHAVE
jgi:hypothetical protein